ncbi:MAG: cupin domain-containing protein [Parvularculaceae bacterium]|nr:cupin domain-containing protein [Parvularculaceae bacterium]
MNSKNYRPLIPAHAGFHKLKWTPAFAGVSGAFLLIASSALAQNNDNPIPAAGGALIMPAEVLPDPLEAGWQGEKVCEVLQENSRMRALRCTFAPGVGHERHYHPPHFGYILEGGKMQITDESGTVERDLETGASWKSDGVKWHEAVNIGDTTSVYIIVEPKGAK